MAANDDVYREYGVASELAQLLETELGTYLLAREGLKARAFLMDRWEEGHGILDRINRKTLGQALADVRQHAEFGDDLESLFADAVAARNQLAHGFFLKHGPAINTGPGRQAMLDELRCICDRIQPAYEAARLLASHVSVDGWTLETKTEFVAE